MKHKKIFYFSFFILLSIVFMAILSFQDYDKSSDNSSIGRDINLYSNPNLYEDTMSSMTPEDCERLPLKSQQLACHDNLDEYFAKNK